MRGGVANAAAGAGAVRTVTALGAIQASTLDLTADGSILLQGGASRVTGSSALADTSAVFLVTGQKRITTTNTAAVATPGFASLVVQGGRAYDASGGNNAVNARAIADLDPSDLTIQTAGNFVLQGGSGPTGSLTSARLDAGNNVVVRVLGGPVNYTYTPSAGGSKTLNGLAFMIGGTGSGFFDGVNNPVTPAPGNAIDINVPVTRDTDIGFGDSVIQVGRPLFDSSLLGYVIFAANEETRASRIRKGLGEGDDLGAPACK